jgi:F-type H+-transporting ATPase subunit b
MRSHHALWIALLIVLASAGPLLAAPSAAGATIDPSVQQPEQESQHGSSAEPPAADHGEGHGAEESPSIFAGNLGNAVWTLAIFLALLFVLGRYAWGPLLQGLQNRERFIRESLEQARDERDEAHALLAGYEAKLAEARGEVEEILDEARRDARVVRQREEEKARDEAEALIARARREIDIATETAVKDLYAKASRLSVEVARKILQRELKPEDHARLIDDAVRSFETRQPH